MSVSCCRREWICSFPSRVIRLRQCSWSVMSLVNLGGLWYRGILLAIRTRIRENHLVINTSWMTCNFDCAGSVLEIIACNTNGASSPIAALSHSRSDRWRQFDFVPILVEQNAIETFPQPASLQQWSIIRGSDQVNGREHRPQWRSIPPKLGVQCSKALVVF